VRSLLNLASAGRRGHLHLVDAGGPQARYAVIAPVEGALSQAVTILESGLIEDRALIGRAQRRGKLPDWTAAVVVGDLPARFRPRYDARFATRFARTGFALTHDWERGRAAPDCPAQFLLARWLLNRAHLIADLDGPEDPAQTRRWAKELGLSRASDLDVDPTLDGHDPWMVSWDLDSVRLDPAEWFRSALDRARPVAPAPRRLIPEGLSTPGQ
jgi:hypothetical protein